MWAKAMCAAVAVMLAASVTPQAHGQVEPSPFRLIPAGGAHWQGGVGLQGPDDPAAEALVVAATPADVGETTVVVFKGWEGQPVSRLAGFFVAVAGDVAAFEPHVSIGYVDASGRQGELVIHISGMRLIEREFS